MEQIGTIDNTDFYWVSPEQSDELKAPCAYMTIILQKDDFLGQLVKGLTAEVKAIVLVDGSVREAVKQLGKKDLLITLAANMDEAVQLAGYMENDDACVLVVSDEATKDEMRKKL